MTAPLELTISDEAFQYLRIQRGAISDLSNDREAWEKAYRRSLLGDFGTMQKWLPEKCGAILDVGSGLGGINILLSRHYGGEPEIWLLDGESDAPTVQRHNQTFNSMDAAFRFLEANSTDMFGYFSSEGRKRVSVASGFDLVISLQAWCFHFAPVEYLTFVKRSLAPGATLILDVRKDRKEWREELRDAFTEVGVAVSPHKFDRVVFKHDR
jgi:SAM-dependent methyltransferase